MGAETRRRPWLAALLSFLQPGLGHVYLRAWVRALLWFALWIGTVTVFVSVSTTGEGVVEVLRAAVTQLNELALEAQLAMLSVTVFSTLDAYWLAARTDRQADRETVATCPHCGKEVDPDLDFCHWCTQELPENPRRDPVNSPGPGFR